MTRRRRLAAIRRMFRSKDPEVRQQAREFVLLTEDPEVHIQLVDGAYWKGSHLQWGKQRNHYSTMTDLLWVISQGLSPRAHSLLSGVERITATSRAWEEQLSIRPFPWRCESVVMYSFPESGFESETVREIKVGNQWLYDARVDLSLLQTPALESLWIKANTCGVSGSIDHLPHLNRLTCYPYEVAYELAMVLLRIPNGPTIFQVLDWLLTDKQLVDLVQALQDRSGRTPGMNIARVEDKWRVVYCRC